MKIVDVHKIEMNILHWTKLLITVNNIFLTVQLMYRNVLAQLNTHIMQ